jgi:hypothetical protein
MYVEYSMYTYISLYTRIYIYVYMYVVPVGNLETRAETCKKYFSTT